jgi:hypothetical protein
MGGIIKLGDEQSLSLKALNAGCDIILDPKDPFTLIQNLNNSPDPELDGSQLEQSVERIISIKEKWLTHGTTSDTTIKEQGVNLRERIARQSICIVRGGVLKSRKSVVYTFDVTESDKDISHDFTERLKQTGVNSEKISISLNSDEEPITDNISDDTAIICLIYTSVGAWKKLSFLHDSFKNILTKLGSMPKETVLISFGSPYVVRDFGNFKTVICSFDSLSECQRAAADILLGKVDAKGHLPVSLG